MGDWGSIVLNFYLITIRGANSNVHCSALLTLSIRAARAWARTITSNRFHTLWRVSLAVLLFTLPLILRLAHAGFGKLVSRLPLHDCITYSLLMLAARRSIVSGFYPAPSELLSASGDLPITLMCFPSWIASSVCV